MTPLPFGNFPIPIDISPLVVGIIFVLVGIFVAAISVILIYHWRRFPFEYERFKWVERVYLSGTGALLAIAAASVIASIQGY